MTFLSPCETIGSRNNRQTIKSNNGKKEKTFHEVVKRSA
jgi:hypothetical protein